MDKTWDNEYQIVTKERRRSRRSMHFFSPSLLSYFFIIIWGGFLVFISLYLFLSLMLFPIMRITKKKYPLIYIPLSYHLSLVYFLFLYVTFQSTNTERNNNNKINKYNNNNKNNNNNFLMSVYVSVFFFFAL